MMVGSLVVLQEATGDDDVVLCCPGLLSLLQLGIREVHATRCHVRFDILYSEQVLLPTCDMRNLFGQLNLLFDSFTCSYSDAMQVILCDIRPVGTCD